MKLTRLLLALMPYVALLAPQYAAAASADAASAPIILQAETARLAPGRAEVVDQASFHSKKGASLLPGTSATIELSDAPPDIIFTVKPPRAGRYVIQTLAAVDDTGRELMARSRTKHDSLFMKIAVGDGRAAKRVVFVPWSLPERCSQVLGIYDLSGAEEQIRVWLPAHVRLDYLDIRPYTPPKVPEAVTTYRPQIIPPPSHPRLWVTPASLAGVKANLTRGENAAVWKRVQAEARKPLEFHPRPGEAVDYNAALEKAAENKAFVYLMTGEKARGREAVALARDYLSAVEFGNLLDITREIGSAIYMGAQVYDWCYDLLTPRDRDIMRKNMLRLAEQMEIGWPPFKQSVVNGHGSEAQLLRDLLAMSIAVYDEDPQPWQYSSYRILEEHVPMRNFEYQSVRHNQGIGYGIYRFGWDMTAAWLLYRMTGEKAYAHGLDELRKYWLYMRIPGGASLADGDGTWYLGRQNLRLLALLSSAYARDPIMKSEFRERNDARFYPLLTLLLNDPDLPVTDTFSALPLTLDFGPVMGGMLARTGWNMDPKSTDVVVMMTGGGYNFGNHQHADAGSFQIYAGGVQVADLGQYVFYGTPYDMNFNKRSVAHSMMLAFDPHEKVAGNRLNDGGERLEHVSPTSPDQVRNDRRFSNGKVLSAAFGPDSQIPDYTYFAADLTSAYGKKLKKYVRSFCFLNLQDEALPAALIVADHMETSGSDVVKSWQVNTLEKPKVTSAGAVLHGWLDPAAKRDRSGHNFAGAGPAGKVILQMLRPEAPNRHTSVLTGQAARTVAGHKLTTPKAEDPQAGGSRLVVTPTADNPTDNFLAVFTMPSDKTSTTPVDCTETSEAYILTLAGRTVVMSKSGDMIANPINVIIPATGTTLPNTTSSPATAGPEAQLPTTTKSNLILTGLHPGKWEVRHANAQQRNYIEIARGKNTIALELRPGKYEITLVK